MQNTHCSSDAQQGTYTNTYKYKLAIVDINFSPGAAIWKTQPNITVWHLTSAATWRTWWNNTILHSGPLAPLRDNMTSSTKPEIHNVLPDCNESSTGRDQVHDCQVWVGDWAIITSQQVQRLMCYQVHDYVASLQFMHFCIYELPATKMLYLTAWTYLVA